MKTPRYPSAVRIDANATPRPTSRMYRRCVGSCHAYLTLREDFRQHVRKIQQAVGFEQIRFHNLFSDLVGVCQHDYRTGGIRYNFQNVEKIFDFFLSLGIKPFVELGFMPQALASGSAECFVYRGNVTPPKDYKQWAALIDAFVRHLLARYGQAEVLTWNFEVWNEPDLTYFWAADQAEYFRLYETTARAIKAIDRRLKVGGPATSRGMWVADLLAYCAGNKVPLDFVSTHHYCADVPLATDGSSAGGITYRGQPAMADDVRRTLQAVRNSAFAHAPVHYTEWNVTPCHEDRFGKDSEFTAAFVLATLNDVAELVDSYSLWCISDIFEESGPGAGPFSGKYGLLSLHGLPKPVFHAYDFLSRLHDARLPAAGPVAATRNDRGDLRLLLWNHNEPRTWDFSGGDWVIDERSWKPRLTLANIDGPCRVRLWQVDRARGNAFRAWQSMGCPEYPTASQLAALAASAEPALLRDEIVEPRKGQLTLTPDLGPCAMAFYDIAKV